MTAQYASTADGTIRVWCDDPACPRPLDMNVGTIDHAVNLAAKHNREHHAAVVPDQPRTESYNVSAAARMYLVYTADLGEGTIAAAGRVGAVDVWHALTGLTGQEARAAAEHAANHVVYAYVPPF